MTIANAAQHALYFIAESTYGSTPATPAFAEFPHSGCTLNVTKEALESEKLRGDRQVEDFRHGNRQVGGDIVMELEYGNVDSVIEALMGGTWATDVLTTGATRRSFTIERRFNDLATPEYHRHTGCEINSLALSVAPNAMIEATFGVIGQDLTVATTAITGATYNAATARSPFDSFTGSINEGGSSIATVTSLELTIENGLEPLFAVGSQVTNRPSIGKSRVTGTLTAYYESSALYNKFLSETESDIVFTLTDPDGNDYTFDLHRVKYNSGQPDVSGEGSVTVSMDFVALFNTGESNLTITRSAA